MRNRICGFRTAWCDDFDGETHVKCGLYPGHPKLHYDTELGLYFENVEPFTVHAPYDREEAID